MSTLEHRTELAQLELQVSNLKADLRVVQACAEQDIIKQYPDGIGKNDTERTRNLLVHLQTHPAYSAALTNLRNTELEHALLNAELQAYTDSRRVEEWSIRLTLAEAISGRVATLRSEPGTDESIDELVDELITEYADDDARKRAYHEVDELFAPEPQF